MVHILGWKNKGGVSLEGKGKNPVVVSLSKKQRKKPQKKGIDLLKALYPFSFFAREDVFRASRDVCERETGFCRVKEGLIGSWNVMFLSIEGTSLTCCKPDSSLGAQRVSTPPIYAVELVGAKLSVTGPSTFKLKAPQKKKLTFVAPSVKECNQWLYKFQNTPGIYRSIEDFYEYGTFLGEGATCSVKECTNRLTGKKLALKIRADSEDEIGRQGMYNELRILQILDNDRHPSIPHLEDYFYNEKGDIKIVMELLEGGELLKRIAEKDHFSENAARKVFRQIAGGVQHLHKHGIAHRDLKPANIMFKDRSEDSALIIIDYDLAKANHAKTWYGGTPVGTTDFMAPEVVQKQRYTLAIDMWSLGCILYILLCGDVPFEGADSEETRKSIVEGNAKYEGPIWDMVSNEAKDLVKGLLDMDAGKRLTADQALNHPWMTNLAMPSVPLGIKKKLSASLSSASLLNLEALQKEVALTDIPDKFLSDEEKEAIREQVMRQSRPRSERNLHRLKAALLAQGRFGSCDMDIGPATPTLSEADQSMYSSTCQKHVFINAFGSAPDLGTLAKFNDKAETVI